MLDIILAARHKRMHPALLIPKQLGPIQQDIQDYRRELAFPISGPNVDTDELTSLSTVFPIYKKGVLKILLDAPLLGRTIWHADYTQFQCSRPSWETTLEKRIFDQGLCMELPAYNICKGNLPVNEHGKFKTCEAELLLNSSLFTFQIGDVQIT